MSDSPSSGQARICTSCGALLKPDANFCTACGAAVGSTRPISAPSASGPSNASSQAPRRGSPWPWVIAVGVVAVIGLVAVLVLSRGEPATAVPAPSQPAAVTAPQQDIPYPDVPRISPADAKAQLDSGQAVIVDVRGAQYYQAAHIDGAVSIPLDQIEAGQHDLPKNAEIITYCT